jgi:hypothetical protein
MTVNLFGTMNELEACASREKELLARNLALEQEVAALKGTAKARELQVSALSTLTGFMKASDQMYTPASLESIRKDAKLDVFKEIFSKDLKRVLNNRRSAFPLKDVLDLFTNMTWEWFQDSPKFSQMRNGGFGDFGILKATELETDGTTVFYLYVDTGDLWEDGEALLQWLYETVMCQLDEAVEIVPLSERVEGGALDQLEYE